MEGLNSPQFIVTTLSVLSIKTLWGLIPNPPPLKRGLIPTPQKEMDATKLQPKLVKFVQNAKFDPPRWDKKILLAPLANKSLLLSIPNRRP